MSIFEYDKELEEKKLRKAEFEAGEKYGHEIGFAEGEKHGHETGFAEGEKQGILLNSLETAKRMLHSGKFSPEEVADFAGLPLDEVMKLQSSYCSCSVN